MHLSKHIIHKIIYNLIIYFYMLLYNYMCIQTHVIKKMHVIVTCHLFCRMSTEKLDSDNTAAAFLLCVRFVPVFNR